MQFNKNGKFVIMQVSDAQDLQFVRKPMLKMLNKAYDMVKPDLVVLTGDNILGNHLRDARFGSKKIIDTKQGEYEAMKKALGYILDPLEERKIPFAMIYGNHDDMNEITKDEQADIYRSYSCNIGLDNPDKTVDCDTYNIPIYSSDGEKVKYNLWMLDSAYKDKEEDKCYCHVKKSAVDWYVKKSNELKEANGGEVVDSLMFQHVPFPETERLMKKCSKNDPERLHLFGEKKMKYYYKINRKYNFSGSMGEYPCCCNENYGQFDAIKKQGDVRAVVFGHDHLNNFTADIDGVHIIQTSCASFRCYGDENRGVRIFIIDENDTKKVDTYFMTYNDICGSDLKSRLDYIVFADGDYLNRASMGLEIITPVVGLMYSTVSLISGIKRYKKLKK